MAKPSRNVPPGTIDLDSVTLDDLAFKELAAKVPGVSREVKDRRKDMIRLAKAVENHGLADDEMIKAAMNQLVDESAQSLKQALVQMNFAREEDILEAIAADMGMERVNLDEVDLTPELINAISEGIVQKYRVVPVRMTDDEIWLALADPSNLRAIDDLSKVLGKTVIGMIATEEQIDKVIESYYQTDDYSKIYEEMAESENPAGPRDYSSINLEEERDEAETPLVVRFVDLLFKQAVYERASDIHIEPSRTGLKIRFRIDGVLQEVPSPPPQWQNAIVSRLKVLASLDLAEKRIPLDGRIKLNIPGKKLDLRVSSMPTIYGETIVMRILDASSVMMGLEDVGFLPSTIAKFKELIRSPNGVILMTGPTGSGKTTTLYAALSTLNTPEAKICTLEDPVEYQIAGINQVQINADAGLTFPMGLRAVLRQSPDVILVGEIRDLETAENAIRAALTGHLVFSTLHTNDAPSATVRLIDMGIKPYLVASSLQAVLAQRLARRICANCKVAYRPKPEEIMLLQYDPEDYKDVDFFRGEGCDRCGQTGHRGRTAIHEVFVIDAEIRRRIIRSEASSRLKRYALTQGMHTLRMDGWEKILMGQTTIAEISKLVGQEL